ncbi:MAG: hypothetical protein CVU08_06560 [Bacteroidetes bacterium HGW-Bacteroidetes-3]|jgi:hypothetical protein|nr:MAG: hypothetical protein CVU08_06560 [Bacteroidetes bacterium HGW-Bacteroidetes-3]
MKIFIEEQKFTQSWLFIGLFIALVAVTIPIVKDWNTISQGNFGEMLNDLGGILVILFVFVLFNFFKLKTRIDEKGVYYQYLPFHFSYRFLPWNSISKCYVRNYNAIFEYGGWGLKFSFRKNKGKSFTVKGDVGLQLLLTNGKHLLIGTQKKEEIQRTLDTYQDKIGSLKS